MIPVSSNLVEKSYQNCPIERYIIIFNNFHFIVHELWMYNKIYVSWCILKQACFYFFSSTLSPRTGRASVTSEGSASSTPSSPAKSVSPMTMSGVESPPPPAISPQSPPPQAPPTQAPPQASPRRINKAEEVSLANQTWGPPRLVELHREPGRTLGISIVGMYFQLTRNGGLMFNIYHFSLNMFWILARVLFASRH